MDPTSAVLIVGLALVQLVGLLVFARVVALFNEGHRAEQALTRLQCEKVMDRLQARTLTEYRLQPEVVPIPGEAVRDPIDPDWEEPSFRRPQEKVPLGLDGEE